MSDYASVAEEARRAFASVAKLESACMRDPSSNSLRINLAAKNKYARQLQDRLLAIAEVSHVEVCNYRLASSRKSVYGLGPVSESMLQYQNMFTQVHDAKRNGVKTKTRFGEGIAQESMLEIAYTYSGSLGVVLLAPNSSDFFRGILDDTITSLMQVVSVRNQAGIKEMASELGKAVVKRVHDWSLANVRGGFDADIRWNRSNGTQIGELIELSRMESIVELIEATSDTVTTKIESIGTLVGIDVKAGSFHLVEPNGQDFRGNLSPIFDRNRIIPVNQRYRAYITQTSTTVYATEKTKNDFVLEAIGLLSGPSFASPSA